MTYKINPNPGERVCLSISILVCLLFVLSVIPIMVNYDNFKECYEDSCKVVSNDISIVECKILKEEICASAITTLTSRSNVTYTYKSANSVIYSDLNKILNRVNSTIRCWVYDDKSIRLFWCRQSNLINIYFTFYILSLPFLIFPVVLRFIGRLFCYR